ncbi:hypothetical protein M6B38_410190 [Iris pallida]|uniref:Uncharacterized protein n=1 Tax=Iris pallida TaxID=29817 RepID=A0AAX6DVY7_IRIPA|nr:hypothetical protein M6B38_223730 [Iris pallida]KAJ6817702.1 hypothetical protein M6B38_410190 [Iris pallida]
MVDRHFDSHPRQWRWRPWRTSLLPATKPTLVEFPRDCGRSCDGASLFHSSPITTAVMNVALGDMVALVRVRQFLCSISSSRICLLDQFIFWYLSSTSCIDGRIIEFTVDRIRLARGTVEDLATVKPLGIQGLRVRVFSFLRPIQFR